MREDYTILKTILEIISSVMKRAVSPKLALVHLTTSNMLIQDSQNPATINSNHTESRDSHYAVHVSD